jgi:sucrose-6-phosphate hydrolase SacC (GH32 family)
LELCLFSDKVWGHIHWAHATSTDLVTWHHEDLAIRKENGISIFSGGAVLDMRNTSGLGINGIAPLVAFYTGFNELVTICFVYTKCTLMLIDKMYLM